MNRKNDGAESPPPDSTTTEARLSDTSATESQAPADIPRRKHHQYVSTISFRVIGPVAVARLILTISRPEWTQRVWDSTGITCGRDLTQEDPDWFDSPWAAWGQAEYDPDEPLNVSSYRENVENLADGLNLEPGDSQWVGLT